MNCDLIPILQTLTSSPTMPKPLTNREIFVYRSVYWATTLLWIAIFLFYFLIGDAASDASLFEICFAAVVSLLAFGFGTALRSDTRIIYGIPWLQYEGVDCKNAVKSESDTN